MTKFFFVPSEGEPPDAPIWFSCRFFRLLGRATFRRHSEGSSTAVGDKPQHYQFADLPSPISRSASLVPVGHDLLLITGNISFMLPLLSPIKSRVTNKKPISRNRLMRAERNSGSRKRWKSSGGTSMRAMVS